MPRRLLGVLIWGVLIWVLICLLGDLFVPGVAWAGSTEDEPGLESSKGPGEVRLVRRVGLSGLADLVLWPGAGVVFGGGAQLVVDVVPHLGLDFRATAGAPDDGFHVISLTAGTRLYPLRQALSPYLAGRLGAIVVHTAVAPLIDVVAGIELATRGGFTFHLEGGVYYVPGAPVLTGHAAAGLGYRF